MKRISTNAKRSNFLKLIKESDRGCVSVVCEFFNKRLAGMLILAICGNVIQKQKIPKGFCEKIHLAYSLKLITPEQFKALEVVRELRNEADHSDIDFNFENEGAIEHLKQLEKYAKMINTDRLMDFEDIIQEVGNNGNMPRFQFLVTTFQVYKALQPKIYELVERL
jgi:hypothetical protein